MEGSSVIVMCLLIFTHTVSGLTSEEKAQFSEDVTLEVDGDVYNFFSSGYPPHDIDNSVNPATAAVKNFTYNITVNPDNEGDQVWCTSLGPVGFATNGVAIYNALTGSTTDAVRYEVFDDCQGHSSPDGAYHYHQFPSCVGTITDVDLFVGVALDGNPIYGPKASDFEELISSADLDACHGRFKDGRYRYHMTTDFPYVIGCYKAEPAESAGPGGEGGGQGPPGGGGGQGPPGGGGGQGPPPGRKRRQTNQATCTNTEYGAMLCDCTSGSLTECDTLTDDDAHLCPGSSTTEKIEVDDDGENGSTSIFVPSVTFTAIIATTISTIV